MIISKEEFKGGEKEMRKERKKRTAALAELYAEADNLLAEMERSAIAGLRKIRSRKSLPEKEGRGKGR